MGIARRGRLGWWQATRLCSGSLRPLRWAITDEGMPALAITAGVRACGGQQRHYESTIIFTTAPSAQDHVLTRIFTACMHVSTGQQRMTISTANGLQQQETQNCTSQITRRYIHPWVCTFSTPKTSHNSVERFSHTPIMLHGTPCCTLHVEPGIHPKPTQALITTRRNALSSRTTQTVLSRPPGSRLRSGIRLKQGHVAVKVGRTGYEAGGYHALSLGSPGSRAPAPPEVRFSSRERSTQPLLHDLHQYRRHRLVRRPDRDAEHLNREQTQSALHSHTS